MFWGVFVVFGGIRWVFFLSCHGCSRVLGIGVREWEMVWNESSQCGRCCVVRIEVVWWVDPLMSYG